MRDVCMSGVDVDVVVGWECDGGGVVGSSGR